MTIVVKNKDTLIYDDFIFKCCVGKNGFSKKKLREIKRLQLENLLWSVFIIDLIKKINLILS